MTFIAETMLRGLLEFHVLLPFRSLSYSKMSPENQHDSEVGKKNHKVELWVFLTSLEFAHKTTPVLEIWIFTYKINHKSTSLCTPCLIRIVGMTLSGLPFPII